MTSSAPSPRTEHLRELMRGKFATALAPGPDALSEDAKSVASLIEAAAATALGVGSKDYTAKGRSLIFNLNKNAQLRAGMLRGDLSAEWLISASVADLATDALKLARQASAERFHAQRSLGQSDDRVVGWNAGTTGKLEWSHKYEQEKAASTATTSALVAGPPVREEDEEEQEAESSALPAAADEGEAELHESAGMEDVEADELKSAASQSDTDDSDISWLNGPSAAPPAGTKRTLDALEDDEDDEASAADMPPKAKARATGPSSPSTPGAGGRTLTYTDAMVRSCTLAQAAAGSGLTLESDEAGVRQRVHAAVARVREIVSDVEATG